LPRKAFNNRDRREMSATRNAMGMIQKIRSTFVEELWPNAQPAGVTVVVQFRVIQSTFVVMRVEESSWK
jgi:hypothetical protein